LLKQVRSVDINVAILGQNSNQRKYDVPEQEARGSPPAVLKVIIASACRYSWIFAAASAMRSPVSFACAAYGIGGINNRAREAV
jgi:hypothetical protein